ncbi:MAG TPA: ATP-binding cassette domain-containing protein, partial [Candidatus Cloacimonadota bacterium]|nr:ATP-binding cassette domain-containing protein [Candidatus Cloacimonadota bacterium]
RGEIGVENIIPKELYIIFDEDFFSISRTDTSKTIGYIEIQDGKYYLYPPRKNWDFYLNNKKVNETTQFFLNTDVLTINKKNFRLNQFYDLIEIPFEIEQINILDLKHFHRDGQLAVDSISLEVEKNQLIGILGQSGCGKSTFLKCIAGEIIPTYGNILYDGKNFYQNINFYSQFVGYVPQEDLLFSNLTVYENLFYRGRLRMPKLSKEYLDQKIRNILFNTNLSHRMNTLVGDIKKKFLSGGERRRLNIALELLFEPTILICDEPTSGLSFSDAEQIIDSLRKFADQGKVVIITIHQPSSPVYMSFDKVLLMDKTGKQVFFGSPDESWRYFDSELGLIKKDIKVLTQKRDSKLPEYIYSIIEYPEYKDNGEIVYEQVSRNAVIKRKFSPDYWRDKYKRKMLFDLIQYDNSSVKVNKVHIRKRKRNDLYSNLVQLLAFVKRSMITKMRSRTNLFITFGEAPILGIIIAFILRLQVTNSGYSFYQNVNLGIYIFISVIVFIFLGLSNSIEEILSERKNLLREKLLNFRMSHYLISKCIVLGLFAVAQVILYYVVSSYILGIKGMFLPYFIYLFLSAVSGFSIGLLISSFLSDSKAIINILPLILIPQIIFGGAIIEYEKMNRNIKLVDANPIPEVVQVMPSRWLFEGLYVSQAKLNPYDKAVESLDKKRKSLNGLSGQSYLSELNQIYKDISVKTKKYPKDQFTNQYLNLSVSLMDGKFLNTNKNIFLSSYKTFYEKRYPTIYFNLIVSLVFIFLLNLISVLKLKFFYKE